MEVRMCDNEMNRQLDLYIKEAASRLSNYEYEKAHDYIMKAICMDPDAPQPHNLLGIWYELKNNMSLARKHYRVAYVLNPTYKPVSVNLERVSTLFSDRKSKIDFGLECNEENTNHDPEIAQ
jgi:Tfp pilus assembly protein PilF